jgi:cytochrome c oxidase assembly protein subunit 15
METRGSTPSQVRLINQRDDKEWEREFDCYKESVEYKTVNKDITLEGFKKIFFIEWFHRLCGNILGGVFGSGLVYFGLRGYFTRKMKLRLTSFFLLGGLQGLIGWWMVKSGIHKKADYLSSPSVSTYRLIIHNGMALGLYTAVFYHALLLLQQKSALANIHYKLSRVKFTFLENTINQSFKQIGK